MINKIYLFLVKNWKTSLAGLIVAILTFLLNMGYITPEQYTNYVGIIGSIGLFLSKDGDKTGLQVASFYEEKGLTDAINSCNSEDELQSLYNALTPFNLGLYIHQIWERASVLGITDPHPRFPPTRPK